MINIFWISYARTVIAIALFLKVYWTDDCLGLSAKSQWLYGITLASSSIVYLIENYTGYYEYYAESRLIEITFVSVLCILVTFCTALLMVYPLRKTYEAKHDTVRIDLLIVACVVLAVLINYKFSILEVFWQFSVYLEAVALIPQCQFTKKSGRVRTFIVLYVVALVAYDALFTSYWIGHSHFTYYYNMRLATLAVQIFAYCYFFFWVLPWLLCCKKSDEEAITHVEVLVDKGGNICSGGDDKADYLNSEEEIVKY